MRLLLTAVACALTVAPTASGWVAAGERWPYETVTVWNATGYKIPVANAMRAWNATGARVRLAAAPSRTKANVVIRTGSGSAQGRAVVGFEPKGSTVVLSPGLGRVTASALAAHELGHVLGLGHETRGCALMAPVLKVGAGSRCGLGACRVVWRCLVQTDDAKGVRSIYGRRGPA